MLDYLQRLAKHATLTTPLLLAIVHFLDLLCSSYDIFQVNSLTIHRFLITAATVASKGLSDSFWNNTTYARVGGIKISELAALELDFLYRVDWRIIPRQETLVNYYERLVGLSSSYTFSKSTTNSVREDDEISETKIVASEEDDVDEEDDEGEDRPEKSECNSAEASSSFEGYARPEESISAH